MSKRSRDPYSYVGQVKCTHETNLALLMEPLDDDEEEFWVPKSVTHDDNEVNKPGDEGTLVVFEWFAEREGWA